MARRYGREHGAYPGRQQCVPDCEEHEITRPAPKTKIDNGMPACSTLLSAKLAFAAARHARTVPVPSVLLTVALKVPPAEVETKECFGEFAAPQNYGG